MTPTLHLTIQFGFNIMGDKNELQNMFLGGQKLRTRPNTLLKFHCSHSVDSRSFLIMTFSCFQVNIIKYLRTRIINTFPFTKYKIDIHSPLIKTEV